MNFVAVDIGASSTRFVSNNGKIRVLPNNMVFLEPNIFVDLEPYDNSVESALEVVITKEGDPENSNIKALIGQLAERFASNNVRPSVLVNKYSQKINYISVITAVALSKIEEGLEGPIYLYLALPPIEVRTAKDAVKQKFTGKYRVEFPKFRGGIKVEFEIADVSCYEESFMALLSYFFDLNGTLKEKAKKYLTGNILSLDIGASTTDLAILKNGRYLDKSGQTYKIGGNIARDYLRDLIRAQYGFDLPAEDAEVTMAEGRLQLGNTYVDIRDLVTEAKMNFAQAVVEQMQSYFRQVNIPIQTIRAIVVSGGGSMQSQYINENGEIIKTSEPMSYYITQSLKDVCPGVEVEPYGDEPRMANIRGLLIRAKVDIAKKSKMMNQKTQTA
jgi:hypothetical protein